MPMIVGTRRAYVEIAHQEILARAGRADSSRGRALFGLARHSFNLDYPPGPFVGDVDNVPGVILMANGGYDPALTPREFRGVKDAAPRTRVHAARSALSEPDSLNRPLTVV